MRISLFILSIALSIYSYGQCVSDETYVLSPVGPYQVGDVVEVNYTLGSFTQLNTNWVIAFQINLGTGWTNLTPTTSPININTNNILGNGYWVWDTQNTFPSGLEFGPGFRFINASWDDYPWQQGDPDWGSSSTGPLSLSFEVTVGETCTSDDLSISINVYGDCLTGGWDNGDCCIDSAFSIYDDSVYVSSSLNSGADTSIVYCSESDQFNLFDLLGENAQIDGIWTPSISGDYLGEFNPSVDAPQEYIYTVSDECNSASSSVILNLGNTETQSTVELQLCENASITSLYNVLGLNNTSGNWSGVSDLFQSQAPEHLGLFNPQEQTFGVYNYTVLNNNGCELSYPVEVSLIEENINAGNDFDLELCIDDTGVNFYNLIGNPDINGVWSPSLNAGYLGYFNPNTNLSGIYTYNIYGECDTYQSQVNVSVIEVVPPPIITN